MNYTGKTALVTGASAGIGEAFAEALAEKGADLVLTARRGDRLNRLAAKLKEKFGTNAIVIEADLSRPDAPAMIADRLGASGVEVDILVNNAGFGLPGAFHDAAWETHRDFIELMATSYAHLVRLFLPGMRTRGFGRIINVASVAGLVPSAAGHTLYGATKAFLVAFSQALAAENAGRDVRVSALCPGFTYSEFHDVNNMRGVVNELPKYMFMQARPVVLGALKAVEARHVVYVPGLWTKFVVFLMRALPLPLAARLVKSQAGKFRNAAGD